MKFKSNLRKIREDLGLSLYKVAKDLGLGWHRLEAIEKGTADRVSIDVLKKVSKYYGISTDNIIYFEDEKKMMKAS